MTLVVEAAYVAIAGASAMLPLSSSGHRTALGVWLGTGTTVTALGALAEVGVLVAMALVVRRRLVAALSDGIRGIARPAMLQSSAGGRDALAIVIAALISGALETVLAPMLAPLALEPSAAGVGLLATGLALASTRFAPAAAATTPGAAGALLVGLAHGLAVAPGASRVGAAFVVLVWLGAGGWQAAELALMVSVPVSALRLGLWLAQGPALRLGAGEIALALLVAFLAARLGASTWRALCERNKSPLLALWLVPLALAILAYGRALGDPPV